MTMTRRIKKILLVKWAEANFDPPPKIATLRAWARAGQIRPRPIKVGRVYMVDEDAEYVPPSQALLDETITDPVVLEILNHPIPSPRRKKAKG